MNLEEAKKYIQEKELVEIQIKQLERERVSEHMILVDVYDKLLRLMFLRGERLRLDSKIKSIERLAPKQQE